MKLIVALGAVVVLSTGYHLPSTVSQQPTRIKPPAARPAQQPAAPTPSVRQAAGTTQMVVYKTPTCGCCGAWVTYARANGFQVQVHDLEDLTEIKRSSGVPEAGASCHTAQVGGYFVEGHVPVEDIRRMLSERPDIRGIAAPGMPAGSPGMEMGDRRDRYEVKAVRRDGTPYVFARH